MKNKLLSVALAIIFIASLFVWEVVFDAPDSGPDNIAPVSPSSPAVDSAYNL